MLIIKLYLDIKNDNMKNYLNSAIEIMNLLKINPESKINILNDIFLMFFYLNSIF